MEPTNQDTYHQRVIPTIRLVIKIFTRKSDDDDNVTLIVKATHVQFSLVSATVLNSHKLAKMMMHDGG